MVSTEAGAWGLEGWSLAGEAFPWRPGWGQSLPGSGCVDLGPREGGSRSWSLQGWGLGCWAVMKVAAVEVRCVHATDGSSPSTGTGIIGPGRCLCQPHSAGVQGPLGVAWFETAERNML